MEDTIFTKLIKVSFVSGKLNTKKVNQIVDTLKTLSAQSAIKGLQLYLKGLKNELDSHRLIIESPIELTNTQIDSISSAVEEQTPVFETEILIKPELLGGLRIKIGDQVLEDTILSRIKQVENAIRS